MLSAACGGSGWRGFADGAGGARRRFLPAVGGSSAVSESNATGVLQSTVTPGKLVAAIQSGSGNTLFQPNGDYVVAASVCVGSAHCTGTDAELSRFTEAGIVDTSFTSMKFEFDGNDKTKPQAIALQSNGEIVVGGLSSVGGGLARLDSNGDLDTTFASGGSLTSDQSGSGLLIQKDTKIVAIGGTDGNLVLARYLAK
jgi:hypothetical protein